MHSEAFVTTVMVVVALLFLASISAVIAARIKFPFTIGLVVVGVLVAFLADDMPEVAHALDAFKLEPVMIMFLFVPILIFESAFSMDVRVMMKNIVPVLTLAGPGLLISTGIIGGLIWLLTPLPLESALIFGCLISATDPVAVIALFKEMGAPKRLTMLMEGESVFNDATAIVTFQIILGVVAIGILDFQTITGGVIDFFVVFFGGLAVGLVIGWLVVQAIPLVGNQPLVHITLTLVSAYGAFIIADHVLATSGIMAVLATGMTIGYYAPTRHRRQVHEYLKLFWEDAAFVANSLIFLMLGLSEKVFLGHAGKNPEGLLYPVLIAIAVVLFSRFVVVFSLVPLVNRWGGIPPVSRGYQTVLAWGGLRGAIAIALAISLPSHFPYRWQIIDFTFGVVLFTLIVNGTTMKYVMDRFGLTKPAPLDALLAAFGQLEAERAALDRLETHRTDPPLDAAVRADHLARQSARVDAARVEFDARLAEAADSRDGRREVLWLQSFAVQRKVYLERAQDGLLTTWASTAAEDDLRQRPIPPRGAVPPTLRLPSHRKSLLRGAARIWALLTGQSARERTQRALALTEESSAAVAAAHRVLSEMGKMADTAHADPEDVADCTRYYEAQSAAAEALYQQVCAAHVAAREAVEHRVMDRLAQDARKDRLEDLAARGDLPETLAEDLRERLGSRGAA